LAAAAALAAVLVACSSSSPSSAPSTTAADAPAAAPTSTTDAPLTGALNVSAAASLTGAFNAAKPQLESSNPGLSLTYNYGGSNALVTQIEQGAPADVFASADQANMNKLVTANMVETPVIFAKNRLEIAVAPGNPKHITSLQDLAGPGLTVVLGEPGLPAGDYTRQVEQQLGITITPKSLCPDVKTCVTEVASGEADATVVYVTDVKAAGSKVTGVTIPDNLQPTITYPIAVVKSTHNQASAQAFVQSAVSGTVHQALLAAGFLAP
jgi:molybdate transport system substrate-binding protein